MSGMRLPREAFIVDVSPRDGLQNESAMVDTADKIALVDGLTRAGVKRIEVTSFVSPKAVPQLADAEAVMAGITRDPGVEYACLVANTRGLERALAARADLVNFVLVSTETFNLRNARMSVRDSLEAARETFARAAGAKTACTAVIGASFHCPFEGRVPTDRVLEIIDELAEAGFREITLADTNGKADPAHVGELVTAAVRRRPRVSFGIHLHDTRGMGLANGLSFLESGGTRIEASLGGIGGCPFSPGATGNACTEDLVYMLESMDVSTGIRLDELLLASEQLSRVLNSDLASHQLTLARRNSEEPASA